MFEGGLHMYHWKVTNPKAVVVIVHGAGEHHGRYEWLIKQLNEHHFYVIAGDLPGQGVNYKKQGHIDSFNEYIETIDSWVKEALELNIPVFIFGHSMGGLAVIRTMIEKQLPVQKVVLSSPCLDLMNYPATPKEVLSKVLNVITPSLRVPSGLPKGSGTRNEVMRKRDAHDPLLVKKVSVRWYHQLVKAMDLAHKKVNQFPDVPLLVMQSGKDLIVNAKSVKQWFDSLTIPNKTYKEWTDLYHEVLHEPEREEVFRYMHSFLEEKH
jgi:lysophospholipase